MSEPPPLPWVCPSCGAACAEPRTDPPVCTHCAAQRPKPARSFAPGILFVVGAFLPAVAIQVFGGFSRTQSGIGGGLVLFMIACCLISGFGLMIRIRNLALRILLGLLLSIGFLVMNLVILLAIGCSGVMRSI